MKNFVISVYLLWGMIQDIKMKKITSSYLKIGSIVSVIIFCVFTYNENLKWNQWIIFLGPGLIFLIAARITKEEIGYGDGFVLLILGICIGDIEIWEICKISIYFICVYTLIMVVRKKIKRKDRIPYLPFLWIAHLLIWGMKYV